MITDYSLSSLSPSSCSFLSSSMISDVLSMKIQVLEETGFDVSGLLNKDEYIEVIFGQQRVRLYIVSGVKDDTVFAPLTKKEISVCVSLDDKCNLLVHNILEGDITLMA